MWHLIHLEFVELIEIKRDEPVFESGLLMAGNAAPSDIRRQLSHWKGAGNIYQHRRNLNCLAPPLR